MPSSAEKGWRGQSGFDDPSKPNKAKNAKDSFNAPPEIEGKSTEKKPDAAEGAESGLSTLEQAEITVDSFAELLEAPNLPPDQKDKMLADLDAAVETFKDKMLDYAEKITQEEKKRLLTGMEKALVALERSVYDSKDRNKDAKIKWLRYREDLKEVGSGLDKIEDQDRKKARGGGAS